MTEKLAAFDLEIAAVLPDDEPDWRQHRPLGITCAAIATPRGVWTYAATDDAGAYAERMTPSQCQDIFSDLLMLARGGYKILTWNGLSFDFDVLAEECKGLVSRRNAASLALGEHHIDMMYHFFTANGYPIGLDDAARGAGLAGKPDGMSGALAPERWERGEYSRVIEYVQSDARQTLALYLVTTRKGPAIVEWTSRSGRQQSWMADRWLTTKEASQLPYPDTSRMSTPLDRSNFDHWALHALAEEPAA